MSCFSCSGYNSDLRHPARANNYELSTMARRFAVMVLVSVLIWVVLIWAVVAVVSASEPEPFPLVERCSVVMPEDLDR